MTDTHPEPPPTRQELLAAVIDERERQHVKWGVQRLSWPEWMAILGEEYGEACKEAVEIHWGRVDIGFSSLRKELVHLAAVAVQVIEHIDEVNRLGVRDDDHEGAGT